MITPKNSAPISLGSLPTNELNRRWLEARAAQGNYVADKTYALTILRRAASGDQLAWLSYYRAYESLVHAWIIHMGGSLDQDEQLSVANEAWGKFARQMTLSKLGQFDTYARILQYLKLCAQSAAIDALRARRYSQEHEDLLIDEITCSLEQSDADPCEMLEGCETLSEIKGAIWRALRTEDERFLAVLIFFQGYSIGEVCRLYPGRFANAKDAYRVLRAIRDRLRRNKELLAFLVGWRHSQTDKPVMTNAVGREECIHA